MGSLMLLYIEGAKIKKKDQMYPLLRNAVGTLVWLCVTSKVAGMPAES